MRAALAEPKFSAQEVWRQYRARRPADWGDGRAAGWPRARKEHRPARAHL